MRQVLCLFSLGRGRGIDRLRCVLTATLRPSSYTPKVPKACLSTASPLTLLSIACTSYPLWASVSKTSCCCAVGTAPGFLNSMNTTWPRPNRNIRSGHERVPIPFIFLCLMPLATAKRTHGSSTWLRSDTFELRSFDGVLRGFTDMIVVRVFPSYTAPLVDTHADLFISHP